MSLHDQAAAGMIARLAMACDGAVLGITLAVFAAQTWAKYKFSSKALGKLRDAPSSRISDLRSLVTSPGSSDSSSTDGQDDGVLVVVRGTVRESRSSILHDSPPLVSNGTGERAVIVERVQTCLYNEWKGIFGWSSDLRTLLAKTKKEHHSYSARMVPFLLVESGTWAHSGFVNVNLKGSSQPLPLSSVYHQLLPIQNSSSTFWHALFGSAYPVAILDEERILPVGAEITAIGICRLHEGALEIKSCQELPYFLSAMTRSEIETDLTVNTAVLFWSGVLLGTFSLGILGYSIYRNWQRWKEWKQSRALRHDLAAEANVEEADMEDDQLGDELGDIPEEQTCVICLARRRRCAFIPCGHHVCCARCAMHVVRESSPICPLCRQSIRSSMRVYSS